MMKTPLFVELRQFVRVADDGTVVDIPVTVDLSKVRHFSASKLNDKLTALFFSDNHIVPITMPYGEFLEFVRKSYDA